MRLLTILTIFFLTFTLSAQDVQYFSGKIPNDTRWSGQIYIDGDVIVPKGVTLSIDSGSRIIFKAGQDKLRSGNVQDRIEFIILGKLLANGKPRNSKILFTSGAPEQQMNDWYGIVFKNLTDKSILQHCIIEYAYKGITCYGGSPLIEDCEVRFNYIAGISCEVRARPIIRNTTLFGNDFAGINCELASTPIIENCSILQNANGVMIFDRSQPDMGRNPRREEYSKGQNRIQNNFDYNIYNHSSNEIYAQNNIWNTNSESEIKQTVYDHDDNPSYGQVLVLPVFRTRQSIRRRPLAESQQRTVPTPTMTTTSPELTAQTENSPDTGSTNAGNEGIALGGQGNNSQENLETDLAAGGSNGTNHEETNDTQAHQMIPAVPETVFVVRETIPEDLLKEKEEDEIVEPVIEGLLDSGQREYIRKVKPDYPKIYKMTGHEGVVFMEVIVGKDGTVQSYRVLRSDGEHFTLAAEEAIKKYRYKPGTFKGKPVSYRIIERFKFQLSK